MIHLFNTFSITFVVFVNLSMSPYRRKLGQLLAESRWDYFATYLLLSILRSGQQLYFFIARHIPARAVIPDTMLVLNCHLDSLRNSFHVSSIALWNSLPLHHQNALSLNIFKSLIKNYLLYWRKSSNI